MLVDISGMFFVLVMGPEGDSVACMPDRFYLETRKYIYTYILCICIYMCVHVCMCVYGLKRKKDGETSFAQGTIARRTRDVQEWCL